MKKVLISTQKELGDKYKKQFDHVSISPIQSFKNGEVQNRIYGLSSTELENAHVYIYHKFSHLNINTELLWLILSVKLVNTHTNKVTLLLPFLPYTRKDRKDQSEKYLDQQSIMSIIGLLKAQGLSEIITADLHNPNISSLAPITVTNIPFEQIFEQYIQGPGCIVSPDIGAAKKVISIAERNKFDCIIMHKKRDTDKQKTEIRQVFKTDETKTDHENFYIIDDMMDTGGTLLRSIEFLKQNFKPAKINILITHSILSESGLENIKRISNDKSINYLTTNSFKHGSPHIQNHIAIEDLLFTTIWKQ